MTTIADKLETLTPRINAAAARLACQYSHDRDDIVQTMTLAIIEAAQAKPDLLNQTDAYIVNLGAWRARDMIRRETCQARYAGADVPETDTGEWALPAHVNPWPDVERRLTLAAIAARLDDDLQAVYDCLGAGLGIGETALHLGIHRSTVNARCKRIAARMGP